MPITKLILLALSFFVLRITITADAQPKAIPLAAQKILKAYPDFVADYADNHLIFKDGSKTPWDDGIVNKTFSQVLAQPDLEDMFLQQYPKGILKVAPPKNSDPGRIRNEAFFMRMYGSTAAAVTKNLVTIIWCPKLVGQKIMVTKVNGVDKKLAQISKELDEHPELKQYLIYIGGTFNWRNIAGTNRHSMHSFGMTVDINTAYANYWQWACKCTNENTEVNYSNRIPQLIVDTFENYGFIWGGKWYHYDTMHFEYRPELLIH
jgi:hypothetical protein